MVEEPVVQLLIEIFATFVGAVLALGGALWILGLQRKAEQQDNQQFTSTDIEGAYRHLQGSMTRSRGVISDAIMTQTAGVHATMELETDAWSLVGKTLTTSDKEHDLHKRLSWFYADLRAIGLLHGRLLEMRTGPAVSITGMNQVAQQLETRFREKMAHMYSEADQLLALIANQLPK